MPTVQDFPDVDKRDYQCIYPQYIDKNLKTSQGRRMPLDKCVERPLAIEMYQICMHLGVPVIFEPQKTYARQSTHRRGRLKVLIKKPKSEHYVKKSEFDQETREIVNPEVPTKNFLMAKMAEIIPTLPNRQKQPEPQQPITTTTDKKKKKK